MNKYSHDQKLLILENAEKYAGSFALALCKAYILADVQNSIKIESVFSDILEQYLNF